MAVPKLPNLDKIEQSLVYAFAAAASVATVALKPSGTVAGVRMTVGRPRAEDITEGLGADQVEIKFLYSVWNDNSPGRAPQKGDIATIDGHRYAFDHPILRTFGARKMMYVVRSKG